MQQHIQQQRIWEIDFFRGLLIPGMILIHIVYDAVYLYRLWDWPYPEWYILLQDNYGAAFVLLSGICVTLGSSSFRRGITVFAGGMICTLVTWGMYALGLAERSIIIYFGVLHCIGVCMMLWTGFCRCPNGVLAGLGIVLAVLGQYLRYQVFDFPWLVVLGFPFAGFSSSDYYPLLPNLGYFLVGAALGRCLYSQKRTRFPHVSTQNPVIRGLTFCGRHSLPIYLLHQPILSAVFAGIVFLRKL